MVRTCITAMRIPATAVGNGSCRAAAWVDGVVFDRPTLVLGASTFMGYHAEEALAVGCWQAIHGGKAQKSLLIHCRYMFVDIVPCDGKRYPGHKCRDMFSNLGRSLPYKGGRTPVFRFSTAKVFYTVELTPKGEGALKGVHMKGLESDLNVAGTAMGYTSGCSLCNEAEMAGQLHAGQLQGWERVLLCYRKMTC